MFKSEPMIEQSAKNATSPPGKDSPQPLADADLRDARAFFADIMKKESVRLPNLKFDVATEGTGEHKTYLLKEESKGSSVTIIREIGRFHQDGAGNRATTSRESVVGSDGSMLMRETDVNVDASSKMTSTKVSEGPQSAAGIQYFQEKSETLSKNGVDISSSSFEYSRQTGELVSGKVITHNNDGTVTDRSFEGGDQKQLRPTSEITTSKNGVELSAAKFSYSGNQATETVVSHNADGSIVSQIFQGQEQELHCISKDTSFKNGDSERMKLTDISNVNQEHSGKKESIIRYNHADKTTTTSLFEGASEESLQAKSVVVTNQDGKVLKSFQANALGQLIENR